MKKGTESNTEPKSDLAPYADPVLQLNALKQLEQALELIPSTEKAAYLEAKKQCPVLVETEPGLLRFLLYDKFDVWAAARRLVKYWSIRKDLFQERAFLPMHQTGNGALSTVDLEVLSTGFNNILPEEHSNGLLVFCAVPSRLDLKSADNMISRSRCSFYIMSVLMNIYPASRLSFSRLAMLNQIGFQRAMMLKPTVEMFKQLPVYPEYEVVAHCPMDVKRKTFFEMVAPTFIKLVQRGGLLEPVSASSREDLADQLVLRGYNRDSLPTECGGTWSVAKFRQWQLERKELERQRELVYFGVARRASVAMGDLEQRKCESDNFGVAQIPPSPLATMDELDKSWEWENLAGAQSQLPLSPTVALDELQQTLEWENPGLMPSFPSATMIGLEQKSFENEKLDNGAAKKTAVSANTMDYNRRVAEALTEHELLRGGTCCEAERLERKRVMDREHSKRKRARRKDRFATLQESHKVCVAENARLKKESAFLKRLLEE